MTRRPTLARLDPWVPAAAAVVAVLGLGYIHASRLVAGAEASRHHELGLLAAVDATARQLPREILDPSPAPGALRVAEASVEGLRRALDVPAGNVRLIAGERLLLGGELPPQLSVSLGRAGEPPAAVRVEGMSGELVALVAGVRDASGATTGRLVVVVDVAPRLSASRARLSAWATRASIVLLLLTAAILLVVAWVTAPVRAVEQRLGEIARGRGDLTQRLPVSGQGAVARLAASFNDFTEKTEGLIRKVIGSAHAVGSSAKRIQAGSQTQVHAATEQAAVLARTSRTLHELVRTFQATATRAAEVAQEARAALADAEQGVARLEVTVAQMEQVSATSVETIQETYGLVERGHEIGQVMALINDIAAKTKLIAFNAAIEASAAGGDAGRRFSVVAQEVRNLAERVVKSTGSIEGIIRDVQARVTKLIGRTEENYRKVEQSYQAAQQAREAIRRITVSVERTTGAAAAIASTAVGQAQTGENLLAALADVDQASQAFKDSIVELKSTSDELDGLFVDLLAQIRSFRVREGTS